MLIVSLIQAIVGIVFFAFPTQVIIVLNLVPKFFPTLRSVTDPSEPLMLCFVATYLVAQAIYGFWWLRSKQRAIAIASVTLRGCLLLAFTLSIVRDGHTFGIYLMGTIELIAAGVWIRRGTLG